MKELENNKNKSTKCNHRYYAQPVITEELCYFGCGLKARFQYPNGHYCCEDDWHACPQKRKEIQKRIAKIWSDPDRRKRLSETQHKNLIPKPIPVDDDSKICFYCGDRANFYFKTNDKYCCRERVERCSKVGKEISERSKNLWKQEEFRKKIGESRDYSDPEYLKKCKESGKRIWIQNRDKMYQGVLKGARNRKPLTKEQKEKIYAPRRGKTPEDLYGYERGQEIKRKRKETYLKNKDSRPKVQYSEKSRKLMSEKKKLHWQDPNVSYNTIEFRQKKSLEILTRLKDPEYCKKLQQAFDLKPNKQEVRLKEILESLNLSFNYTGDFSKFIGGRNPDFIDDQKKLIIDFFGNYWHGKSFRETNYDFSTNKDHEQSRINHFKKYGYECLVIWEHELKDLEKVKEKILNFIEENKNGTN